MSLPRQKWKFESAATCTDADRELEQAVNARLERGRISAYSHPKGFGVVFSWRGINRTAEQEQPFDVDQAVTLATQWADKMENQGLPKGWSYDPR
jgi:hypothetical protein